MDRFLVFLLVLVLGAFIKAVIEENWTAWGLTTDQFISGCYLLGMAVGAVATIPFVCKDTRK